MNKQKFIELLSGPERASAEEYQTLEKIVREYPYFQAGHTVLAKSGQALKLPNAKRKIATAATYATNRNIFKQYILRKSHSTAPTEVKPTTEKQAYSTPNQASTRPSSKADNSEQGQLISEIYSNLETWKTSREQYLEFDKAHPEDIIIEQVESHKEEEQVESQDTSQVDSLKSQVAAEVAAEESAKKEQDSIEEKEAELEKIKAQVTEEALLEEKNKTLEAAEIAVEEFTKLEKEKAKTKLSEKTTPPIIEEIEETITSSTESKDLDSEVLPTDDLPDLEDVPEIEATTSADTNIDFTKEAIDNEEANLDVYSFNKPIPAPQGLPEEFISQKEKNPEPILEAPQKEEKQESIEPEKESGSDLISSDELSAIVDQVSDEVENSDSTEDVIVEEISEDEISAFNSQILEMDEESIGNTEEQLEDSAIETKTEEPEKEEEEEEDDGSGLSNKISLDDVKKFNPDDVYDTKFEGEDIDFKGDDSINQEEIQEDNVSVEKPSEVESKETKPKATNVPVPLENPSMEELDELEISDTVDISDISLEEKLTKEESEKVLGKINEERKTLKLVPGASKGAKKFRLAVMKRPHNFTKPKKEDKSKRNRSVPEAKTIPAPIEEPSIKIEAIEEPIEKIEEVVEKKATIKEPTTKTKTVKTAAKKAPKKTVEAKKPATKKASASKTKKASTEKKSAPKKKAVKDEKVTKKEVKKKAPVTKKKTKSIPLDQTSIIDSFIASQPSIKISKDKSENLPIEDLSDNYDSIPDSLITENLADILLEQGKKEKSVNMIEKLILKHPEKKNYYKIKIDQINKEIE
ncbi:MAG: hypothetical protein OCD76_00950 [Reichenbachiella sp.]